MSALCVGLDLLLDPWSPDYAIPSSTPEQPQILENTMLPAPKPVTTCRPATAGGYYHDAVTCYNRKFP